MLKLIVLLSFLHLNGATNAPIIGILAQETSTYYDFDSFVAASYVKFVEAAGGRVIPVWINQSLSYYERVIQYTNGILFPGGKVLMTAPEGYANTARVLYNLAKNSNDKGNFYPVWGTCLGFEVIPVIEIGKDVRIDCSVDSVGLPINFTEDFKKSRLFQHIPDETIRILSKENVTFNSHNFCLTTEILDKYDFFSNWKVLSTNTDNNGLEFISTMEHIKYPFYGVQYHLEKNGFEFNSVYNIPHGADSTIAMQYFTNFFINEARKNENQFPTKELSLKSMIYNYNSKFSALDDRYYFMVYGFYKNEYVKNQLK